MPSRAFPNIESPHARPRLNKSAITLWPRRLGTPPSGGELIVPVLAVLGAELARAVALCAFAECVRDFAVPVADRTCVKIAVASMTFGHHEFPTGGEPAWPNVTPKM